MMDKEKVFEHLEENQKRMDFLVSHTGFKSCSLKRGRTSGVKTGKQTLTVIVGDGFFAEGSPMYHHSGFMGHNHIILHTSRINQSKEKDSCTPIWRARVLLVKRIKKPIAIIYDGYICDVSSLSGINPRTRTIWAWTETGIKRMARKSTTDAVVKQLENKP